MIVKNNYYSKCKFGSRTWFQIGELIYLLSEGSNEGYKLWLTYSTSDPKKYNEEHCYRLWSGFDYVLED